MNQINKYFLYISLFFNGGLLLYLFGALPFFLFSSVVTNVILLWYVKNILEKNVDHEEDIIDVVNKIEIFTEHVENIHQLEMYYGDENLQSLIKHSKQLVNDFIDFQESYFDVEVDFEPAEDEEKKE